ncbi:MAG TPA: type II secretion system F family protein [Steroidobacteraceae bacterium]|nr:type II secretion system F family protein [Steroidobacteraceae bacterium]
MAAFHYRGRSQSGALLVGQIEGDSADSVALRLLGGGITPIEIAPAGNSRGHSSAVLRRLGFGRPSTSELVLFTRQMYTIAKAGVPLLRGLRNLAASTRHPWLRESLEDVAESLAAGRGLADSLARHAAVFPLLYVSIVRIGEATGTLEASFQRLAEYLTAEQALKDRVSAAMRYPMIVMLVIALAIAVLTVFVIPRFAPLFRALGNQLPLPTRLLIGTATLARRDGVWILAAGALLWWLLRQYVQRDAGRYQWHRLKLRLPVFGQLVHQATLARVSRSLAIGLAAGMPIVQTLQLIARSAGNDVMSERVMLLKSAVERGQPLSRAAASVGLFTPLVLQMMEVGEETGEMSEMLDEVCAHYAREVDVMAKALGSAIEPLLIVCVGAIVALLALSVFLPLWQMIGKVTTG